MAARNTKAIIFDMDNTLLKSNIDFKAMKADVFGFLTSRKVISSDIKPDEQTTSTLIEAAKTSGHFDDGLSRAVWHIVRNHEIEGMKGAKLEPHVEEVLEKLSGRIIITVLTNNAYDAAISALRCNGIDRYFDYIAGREQVSRLKPSPDGILFVMGRYPKLLPDNWICAGDSWIDGKAAINAGINFISYRGIESDMNGKGVYPLHTVQDIAELPDLLL